MTYTTVPCTLFTSTRFSCMYCAQCLRTMRTHNNTIHETHFRSVCCETNRSGGKRDACLVHSSKTNWTACFPPLIFLFYFWWRCPFHGDWNFPFFHCFSYNSLLPACLRIVGRENNNTIQLQCSSWFLPPSHPGEVNKSYSFPLPCSIPNHTLIYSTCLHIFSNIAHLYLRCNKSLTIVIRLRIKFLLWNVHWSSTQLNQFV